MKTIQEVRHELTLKELRVDYWENYGFVPSTDYLRNMIDWEEGA